MDEARKIASVKEMRRKSGAPRGFDLAVTPSDEDGSFTDDRPVCHCPIEHARKQLAVGSVESIDVGALGREAFLDFRVESAGVAARARRLCAPRSATDDEDIVAAIVQRADGFDGARRPSKSVRTKRVGGVEIDERASVKKGRGPHPHPGE